MARELIGYISVDSGTLAICDPFYLTKSKLDPVDLREAALQGMKQVGSGSWQSAIIVPTIIGDGIFPVYRDGTDIIIALSEWLWDYENGEGIVSFNKIPVGE